MKLITGDSPMSLKAVTVDAQAITCLMLTYTRGQSMEIDEMFVPIPFLDKYAVSNYGTVINLETELEVEKWLNIAHNRMKVRFFVLGAYIDFFVDDLVTEAFFVNWQPGIKIYYKNHDHTDCTVLNLTFDHQYAEEDDGNTRSRLWIDNGGKIRARN